MLPAGILRIAVVVFLMSEMASLLAGTLVRSSATRSVSDYTVRTLPFHPRVQVPLESLYVLWQR